MHCICAVANRGQKVGIRSPETGVIGGCEFSGIEYLETGVDPLQAHEVTEPSSLQPLRWQPLLLDNFFFLYPVIICLFPNFSQSLFFHVSCRL